MQANRWVRTGLMLSVMWAFGAAIHTHQSDVERANYWVKTSYDSCLAAKQKDTASCDAERSETYKTWIDGDKTSMVLMALAPIPFVWLAVFVLVYVVKAQIAGFGAVIPWQAASRRKKWFIGFCYVCSALFLLVCCVWVTNLYVDTKVPVGIAPFQDLTKSPDGSFVTATGTWTRTDLTNDTIADPLQTSKIECDRSKSTCTEAVASVGGNTLMTDVVDYDVQSWTPDAIVMRKDDLCATELFTIDLNTKVVTGAGHSTHETDAFCAMGGSSKREWTMQLSNGFKVYWELRQKARPWPLRVIQSLFGN